MESLWITISLITILVILLALIFRSREHSKSVSNAGIRHQSMKHITPAPIVQNEVNSDIAEFEVSTDLEFEKAQALLRQKETCEDTDPVVTYYKKQYKNRWNKVKPDINEVGFTPIAKRSLYIRAPCLALTENKENELLD